MTGRPPLCLVRIALLLALGGAILAGCGSTTHQPRQSEHGGSLNVAIVDTPNTEDLARLTPSLFTATTHIEVNYTILDEGNLRDVITQDKNAGSRQFDIIMIGPYEAGQYGKEGYLRDLTPLASSDQGYRLDDVIPTIRTALSYHGRLYAAPFYGESSFLMYRKDVLQADGIEMPAKPTWTEVASIARKINRPGMAGICLRGKPGYGEMGAPFTTMLNTFGGTWWLANPDGSVGSAMVDQTPFRKTLEFYVDLIKDAGESDAARSSYLECLSDYLNGKVAMWYDATVAAGQLEAADSPVKGRNGYVPAPVELTKASGWLYSWAFSIPKSTSKVALAWRYISWATGPRYNLEAGPRIPGGWAAISPGTRRSTYQIPAYRTAARAFVQPTLAALESAPIDNPGTTKRPGLPGIHYVGIPQYQSVGNQCTELFSAVIAGKSSIDNALRNCQTIASRVGR
jgi:sorbitol/mannitol transport system substrate-binding protein